MVVTYFALFIDLTSVLLETLPLPLLQPVALDLPEQSRRRSSPLAATVSAFRDDPRCYRNLPRAIRKILYARRHEESTTDAVGRRRCRRRGRGECLVGTGADQRAKHAGLRGRPRLAEPPSQLGPRRRIVSDR